MTALSFTARPSRRGSAVALGASGLAILGVLSVTSLRHSVERKLTEKASANLAGTGLNEVTIHVNGRDASI